MIINFKYLFFRSKIRKVSVNMSSIAYNNQQLKHRNEELKEIVGEISVRRHFSNGAKVVFNEKDMMIEKMRLALKVLRRKIRQEDSDRCECEYDADADDEDEDDNEGSNQLSYNELLALNLPLGFYGTTPSSYLLDSSNGASLTDDDIANNGRDVDDDIEIEEPVSLPVYQNQDPQEANPCQPSTSTGIVYHMFEYETAFY